MQVKALYLPPTTLLRYNTSRNPWTREEAFRDTRLVFVIWDTNTTDLYQHQVQWMNISLKEDLGVSIHLSFHRTCMKNHHHMNIDLHHHIFHSCQGGRSPYSRKENNSSRENRSPGEIGNIIIHVHLHSTQPYMHF